MKKALLLSASSYRDTGYLVHCKEWINEFVSQRDGDEILFIPFAGVRRTNEQYEAKVRECLGTDKIVGINRYDDKKAAVKNASIIAVGGGNTFMLLHELYRFDLVDSVREAVENGALYFGWSAGANVAGSTMMTTNDMPIVMPRSFDSFKIFPHQINPHFISGKIAGHNGESREERLEEFLIANQSSQIYALPEGSAIAINGNEAQIMGYADALKFEYQKEVATIKRGEKFKI